MTKNENYFTLNNDDHVIQVHGFGLVKKSAYIMISQSSEKIVVNAGPLREKENCFKVDLSAERTIENERLYHLLNHYNLDEKIFINNRDSYYPTDIQA